MATDTLKPEVAGQVVLEKGAVKPGLPPEHRRAGLVYQREIAAHGHRSAAEVAAARKMEADSKAAKKTIDSNIGKDRVEKESDGTTDKIVAGKPVYTESGINFNTATNYEAYVAQFLKAGKGWEGFNTNERNVLRPAIIREMTVWVGDSYFSGMTNDQINTVVDSFLTGDGEIFDKVKELYDKRLVNPEGEDLSSEIAQKQKELEAKEKEMGDKVTEEGAIETKLKKAEVVHKTDWVERPDPSDPDGKPLPGLEQEKLNTLLSNKLGMDGGNASYTTVLEGDLTKKRNAYDAAERKFNTLVEAGAPRDRIDEARVALENAGLAQERADTKLIDYNILRVQIQDLENAKVASQNNIDTQQQQLKDTKVQAEGLVAEYENMEKELGELQSGGAAAEKRFADSIRDIFPDAVGEVFAERVGKLEAADIKEVLKKIEDPKTDPYVAALLSGVLLRYEKFDEGRRHGRFHSELFKTDDKRVLDKDAIKTDLARLTNSNSEATQKDIIKGVLSKATNPETGKAFEPGEVDAFLAANPDFVANNIQEVTARLVAVGLRAGEVKVKDMEALVDNGHISNEKMVEVFTKNEEFREQMKKAGIPETAFEMIKDKLGHKGLWLWMLLFVLSPGLGTIFFAAKFGKDQFLSGGKHGGGEEKDKEKDGKHDKKDPEVKTAPVAESASDSGEGE